MANESRRRVVITGLGIVAPNGIGAAAFWEATLSGTSGISHVPSSYSPTDKRVQVAGIVRDFVAEAHLARKQISRSDRMTHFAFAALAEALADARLILAEEDPQRVGAVIANTMGGVGYVLQQLQTLYTRGPRFMSAFTAIAWLHVANVGHAAIHYGIQGYCKTPVNDTVGGLEALTMATGAIRRGAADVILAGGCEAFLHPFVLLVLAQQGQCVTGADIHAYRPFDQRAAGLVLAEGAGICILEEYEHALRRGAPIYGEIVGYGHTNDAHGLHPPSADGTRYARALCQALEEGNIAPADLAYVSLDGRAWPSSDRGEVDALCQAFGPGTLAHLPVSVPRTMLGHSYAAAGALDVITALLALRDSLIPPTINCEEPAAYARLNIVHAQPRPLSPAPGRPEVPGTVLIGGRGVGGSNVALAVRKDKSCGTLLSSAPDQPA